MHNRCTIGCIWYAYLNTQHAQYNSVAVNIDIKFFIASFFYQPRSGSKIRTNNTNVQEEFERVIKRGESTISNWNIKGMLKLYLQNAVFYL